MTRLVVALIAVLVLAACGTSAHPVTGRPSPLDGCVRPSDHATVLTIASRAAPTHGVLLGNGPSGVVVSHQSDGDLCQMLPIARLLAAHGFHVLAWDAGVDPLPELASVTARLRQAGAHRVVLLGASMGAKESLVAATTIRPAVDGVVALSAEATLGGNPVAPYVQRLAVPLLLATSTGDYFGSASAAATFLRVSPSRHKQLLRVGGTDHGVALLSGAHRDQVQSALLEFLDRYDR